MTRPHAIWFASAGAALAFIALVAYVIAADRPSANVVGVESAAEPIEAWCAEGLEAIPGGGCFAPPHALSAQVPLLVYLHGRYTPETTNEELDRQMRVARLAAARGFAVLALRGKQGECSATELKEYWCWPSNERNQADGPAFVARWSASIQVARKRLGAGPNVLLGFSNGAYFATLIATRALAPFDAIVIAHGGPVEPTHAEGATPPLLLITADDDASDPEMHRLDDELSRASWPHEIVAREGGHALPDWDIDTALTFFTRTRSEKFPLVPAMRSRGQRHAAVSLDASLEDATTESDQ